MKLQKSLFVALACALIFASPVLHAQVHWDKNKRIKFLNINVTNDEASVVTYNSHVFDDPSNVSLRTSMCTDGAALLPLNSEEAFVIYKTLLQAVTSYVPVAIEYEIQPDNSCLILQAQITSS